MKQLAVLVDLSTLMYRSYYSKQDKRNPVAIKTLKYILNIIESYQPVFLVLVLDAPRDEIYRKKLDPKYKGDRKPRPEAITEGLKTILEFSEMFNIKSVLVDGNEADDVIASLVIKLEKEGVHNLVVTSDADLVQLHSKKTKIAVPTRNSIRILRTWKQVQEQFSNKVVVDKPEQLRDYLAIVSDKSDGIEGIKGIGKVNGKRLIDKYGSVREMFASDEELPFNLREHENKIYKNRNLVKLYSKLEVPAKKELTYGKFDYHKALEWMDSHGLAEQLFNNIIDIDF